MSDLIFKPIISLTTMIPIALVSLVIIFLNGKNVINRVLIILLLLLVTQRPMLRDRDEQTFNMDLDVIFVIDNTVSMNATDVNNMTRLNAVKMDCMKLIDRFSGSNFAVITYSNYAQIKYPFTNDIAIIKNVLQKMKVIDPVYAAGSTLDMPYNYMKMLLESSRKKDKHKTIVFFMGDGELNGFERASTDIDKYKNIVELIDSGAVLGYGTTNGSNVKVTESIQLDKVAKNGLLIDGTNGQPITSKMNEDNLKRLAKTLSLPYYHMTDFSVLSGNLNDIKDEAIEDEDSKQKMDKDIYYYFSGALTIFLLLELLYCRRNEQ